MDYPLGMKHVWRTVDRPGYMGDARDRLYREWDEAHGKGLWRIAWTTWEDEVIEKDMALQIYEDGYFMHFLTNPGQLLWLVNTASEVYDTAESNVNSGFDYNKQETPNNHLHDIAIRRAVARHGDRFRGDHLVWVRGPGSEGEQLNPGVVHFHLPHLIYKGSIKNASGKNLWWDAGSIEDFYQRNKVLQVREATEADRAGTIVEAL